MRAYRDLGQDKFNVVNSQTLALLPEIFKRWERACGQLLEFRHIEKASLGNFKGIIIANCDNLDGALGYWDPILSPNHAVDYGIVCIPSTYFQNGKYIILDNLRSISHEIGHAIGLKHFHENYSVKQYLQSTEEGLGCSVMVYDKSIRSALNECHSIDACLNTKHAILPGPLDGQVCRSVYGDDSPYWLRSEIVSDTKVFVFEGMRWGYFLALKEMCEYFFQSHGSSKLNAKTKTLAIYYSLLILKLFLYHSDSNLSHLYSEVNTILLSLGIEMGAVIISMLSDYLQKHDNPMFGRGIQMVANSVVFFGMTHQIWTQAPQSFQQTWNYTITAATGFACYGVCSWIGKNTFLSYFAPKSTQEKKKLTTSTEVSARISGHHRFFKGEEAMEEVICEFEPTSAPEKNNY